MENTNAEVWTIWSLTPSWSPSTVTWKILNWRQYWSTAKDQFTYSSAIPAWTISLWINKNTVTGWRIFWKTQLSVTDVITITLTSSKIALIINDSADLNSSASTLSDNTWYHYAITWDWSNVIVYKNWAVETTQSSTKTVQANAQQFSIWNTNFDTSQPYAGIVDELWIWTRALSSWEISQLYNSWNWLTYPFTISSTNLSFLAFM